MAEAPSKANGQAAPSTNPLASLALFAGEATLPGSSHVLKGDLASGAVYGLAGLAATVMFGPIGRLIVGAASHAKATTGTDVLATLKAQPGA
jgi:hypothetical protein